MFFFSSEPFIDKRTPDSPFWARDNGILEYRTIRQIERAVLKLNDLTQIPLGDLLKTPEGRRQLQRAHLGLTTKHPIYRFHPFLGPFDLVSARDCYYDHVIFNAADISLCGFYFLSFIDFMLRVIPLMFSGGFFSLAAWGQMVLASFFAAMVFFSLMFIVAAVIYVYFRGFSGVVNLFKRDVNPLVEYLKGIPSYVEAVDLENNALGVLPVEDLCNLLQAIPATVEYIYLFDNALFDHWKSEEMRKLIETKLFDDPRLIVSDKERKKYSHEIMKWRAENFFSSQEIWRCIKSSRSTQLPMDMMGHILQYIGNFEYSEIPQIERAADRIVAEYVEAHPLSP